jgi:hypothetical protein
LPLFTISATASCNYYGTVGNITAAEIPHDVTIVATGSTGLPNLHGDISGTFPAWDMDALAGGHGSIVETLPALTVSMKPGGHLAGGELPSLTSSITAGVSRIGNISGELPALTITISAGKAISGELPIFTAELTGNTGRSGSISGRLPAFTIEATGDSPVIGRISGTLPKLQMAAAGSRITTVDLSGDLPALTLEMSFLAGVLAQIEGSFPILEISATGHIDAHGNLSGTLPSMTMLAQGLGNTVTVYSDDSTESITGYAICMNAEHGAVTEYFNFGFNSFAFFDGKYIGAKSDGIHQLTGETDNGVIVDSQVRTSTSDFGSSLKKRAPKAYIGLSSTGTIDMKVITDRGEENDALSIQSFTNDMATQKIKIGRGIKSRYWALEISNPDGNKFNLDSMELEPEVSGRKS